MRNYPNRSWRLSPRAVAYHQPTSDTLVLSFGTMGYMRRRQTDVKLSSCGSKLIKLKVANHSHGVISIFEDLSTSQVVEHQVISWPLL